MDKLLYSEGQQPGEMADSCPKATPKLLLDHESLLLLLLFVFVIMKTFKWRIIWEVYQHHYLPLCADFLLIGWW